MTDPHLAYAIIECGRFSVSSALSLSGSITASSQPDLWAPAMRPQPVMLFPEVEWCDGCTCEAPGGVETMLLEGSWSLNLRSRPWWHAAGMTLFPWALVFLRVGSPVSERSPICSRRQGQKAKTGTKKGSEMRPAIVPKTSGPDPTALVPARRTPGHMGILLIHVGQNS